MKAMIINRIGDFGLSLGIAAIFLSFNTLDFPIIFSLVPYISLESFTLLNFEFNKITIISLLIFVGAVGKSAQIGLHT
jgi:NADH-quinone oxidoreductase subunit L